MDLSQLQYQVLITPLIAKNTYVDEIDVTEDIDISEFVSEKGIGKIKNKIDKIVILFYNIELNLY